MALSNRESKRSEHPLLGEHRDFVKLVSDFTQQIKEKKADISKIDFNEFPDIYVNLQIWINNNIRQCLNELGDENGSIDSDLLISHFSKLIPNPSSLFKLIPSSQPEEDQILAGEAALLLIHLAKKMTMQTPAKPVSELERRLPYLKLAEQIHQREEKAEQEEVHMLHSLLYRGWHLLTQLVNDPNTTDAEFASLDRAFDCIQQVILAPNNEKARSASLAAVQKNPRFNFLIMPISLYLGLKKLDEIDKGLAEELVQLQVALDQYHLINGLNDATGRAAEEFCKKAFELAQKLKKEEAECFIDYIKGFNKLIRTGQDNIEILHEKIKDIENSANLRACAETVYYLIELKNALGQYPCDNTNLFSTAARATYQHAGQLAFDLMSKPMINQTELNLCNVIIRNTTQVVIKPWEKTNRINLDYALTAPLLKKSSNWAIFGACALTVLGIAGIAVGLTMGPVGLGLGLIIGGGCFAAAGMAWGIYQRHQYNNRGEFSKALCPKGLLAKSINAVISNAKEVTRPADEKRSVSLSSHYKTL